MSNEVHVRILDACHAVIRPLARALLANGISFTEFDSACRKAFVAVASEEFGLRGRATSASRISAMTGISRKEVQRLRSSASDLKAGEASPLSPLADLLHEWATSSKYLDQRGQPLELSIGDAGSPSFNLLVRECMGDVPPGAVKKELVRLGAIEHVNDDRVRLVRRSLIPDDVATRLESAFVYSLRGLAETIARNTDPRVPETGRHFERYVESRPLSDKEIEFIQTTLVDVLVGFTEQLDSLLAGGGPRDARPGDRRVGVGIYYSDPR